MYFPPLPFMLFLASFLPFPFPQLLFFSVPSGLYFLHFQKICAGGSKINSLYKGRDQGEKLISISISSPLPTPAGQSAALSLAEGEGIQHPGEPTAKQIPLQLAFPILTDHSVKQQEHFTPEPATKGTAGSMFKCWSIISAISQVLLWALNALLSVPQSPGSLPGQCSATPSHFIEKQISFCNPPHQIKLSGELCTTKNLEFFLDYCICLSFFF